MEEILKKELLYEDIIENEDKTNNIQEVKEEKTEEEHEQMILRYKRIKYSRYL